MITVPVIVVFTKYEDFQDNVKLDLEDKGMEASEEAAYAECEKRFKEIYCKDVPGSLAVIKLESENQFIITILHTTDGCLKE